MTKEIKLPAVDSSMITAGYSKSKFELFIKYIIFYGWSEISERMADLINKTNNGHPGSRKKSCTISLRDNHLSNVAVALKGSAESSTGE